MFVNLFRKSYWYTPVLLVLTGVIFWGDAIWFPERMASHEAYSSGPLYHLLWPVLELNPHLSLLLAFCLLIFQAFYINHISTTRQFTERFSALPALIYLLIMSSSTALIDVHPLLFSNFFLVIALHKVYKANKEHLVMAEVFNVGFMVAVAGLFYFPAMAILLLLIMSLFVYFIISLRAILATLFGFLTPLVFLGIYYYMTDELEARLDQAIFYLQPPGILQASPGVFEQVFILAIASLALIAFIRLLVVYMPDQPIRIRKRIMILLLFFLVSLLSYGLATDYLHIHHALIAIPLSISLASFFDNLGRRKLAEIIFSVLFVLVAASRFYGYFIF